MKGLGFLVVLVGMCGVALAAGASNGWASGIAWIVALAVAVIARRWSRYRAYARSIMGLPEYQTRDRGAERRARKLFGKDGW